MPAKRLETPLEGADMQDVSPNFMLPLHGFQRNEKHGNNADTEGVLGLSETSTRSDQSKVYYNNYRKTVNNNLAKLNNDISEMLSESFKGIDSICNKVRECISDFNSTDILTPSKPEGQPYTESFADDGTTLKKQKEEETKYKELKKRYRQYRIKSRAQGNRLFDDDTSQFDSYKDEESCESEENRSEQATSSEEAPSVEKRVLNNENLEETATCCVLEGENLNDDKETEEEMSENDEDVKKERDEEKPVEKTSDDTINLNDLCEIAQYKPDTENVSFVEQTIQKPDKTKSRIIKMDRNRKRLRRRSLEEYTQAVQKEVDIADLDSIQIIIEDLTERINTLSAESLGEKFECEETEKVKKSKNIVLLKTSKQDSIDFPAQIERKTNGFMPKNKSMRELLKSILTRALTSETSPPGKHRSNFTDVHHRPAVTNLHKKLLVQDNDSLVSFQRLMAKHKVKNDLVKRLLKKFNVPSINSSSSESLESERSNEENFEDSEDEQPQKIDLKTKYPNSLWFDEKKIYKNKSKILLQQLNRQRANNKLIKSFANIGNENTAELKTINATLQPKMKKPKLTEEKLKHKNPNYKTCIVKDKQNSDKTDKRCITPAKTSNLFLERESSSYSLSDTKLSVSTVSLGEPENDKIKNGSSQDELNDHGNPTKTAPIVEVDSEEAPNLNDGQEGTSSDCQVTTSNDAKVCENKVSWMRHKPDLGRFTYLDILDDLTHKDLPPIRAEYPRKDEVVNEEPNRDFHDTYLWRMMYGHEKNDNIWSHLLQPKVDSVDNTCNFYEQQEKDKRTLIEDTLRSAKETSAKSSIFESETSKKFKIAKSGLLDLSDRTFRSVRQRSKRKTIEKLTPYLFDPKEQRNNQSLIVMPVNVLYDNPPVQIIHNINVTPEVPVMIPNKSSKTRKTATLEQPAMKEVKYVRAKWTESQPPVGNKRRVVSLQSTPQSLSITRLEKLGEIKKEKNSIPKKENNPVDVKPFTYDPASPEPQKLTPQQTAYKKAIMRNLTRLKQIKEKEKIEQQKYAVKEAPPLQSKNVGSNFPHYARPTIQSQHYFQKATSAQNIGPVAMNNIKKLAEIKPTSDRRTSPRANDYDMTFSDNKSDHERKMLSHKYGKSVGEKLVSFLNHQPVAQDLLIPTTMDNHKQASKCAETMDRKHMNASLMKGDHVINNHPPKPSIQQRQAMMHLKGVKKNNTEIHNNIQNAINVIENKMVDILKGPGDSSSMDAFDVMEKEIRAVLSLMKTKETQNPDPLLLEENLENISKELFSKLEIILDAEPDAISTESAKSSIGANRKKPSELFPVADSVTTLVTEEKYKESDTKLRNLINSPAEKQTIKTENDLFIGENTGEHIFDYKEDVDSYQDDQPCKDIVITTDTDSTWDPSEELHRLDKILKESKDDEAVKTNDNTEEEVEPLLERQGATTRLDTIASEIKDVDDEDSKEKIELSNSLLEFPHSESVTLKESPIKDDSLKSPPNDHQPLISHLPTVSESTLSESPHRDDSPSMSPLLEAIYLSSDEFLTPPATELNFEIPEEGFMTPPEEIFSQTDEKILEPLEEFEKVMLTDSDGSSSNISDQVKEIIQKVEDIYTRLDDLQQSPEEKSVVPVFSDIKNVPEVPTEGLLTPFMQAVRDRKTKQSGEPATSSDGLGKTPSFYNILSFLDTLHEIDAEKAQEVHTARLYKSAFAYYLPNVLHQATIEYTVEFSLPDKPSCLKTRDDSKRKKRVSFLVLKEDKSAQATFRKNKRSKREISKSTSDKTHSELENKSDSVSKEVQNVQRVEIIDNFYDTTPSQSLRFEISYNTYEDSTPELNNIQGVYGTHILLFKNAKAKRKPVIERYLTMVDLLKRPKSLERLSKQLMSSNVNFKNYNVTFLKSFYAFMYLLVFAALNMEYKCF